MFVVAVLYTTIKIQATVSFVPLLIEYAKWSGRRATGDGRREASCAQFHFQHFVVFQIYRILRSSPLIAISILILLYLRIFCVNRIHFIFLVHPSLFESKTCSVWANWWQLQLYVVIVRTVYVRVDWNGCVYECLLSNRKKADFFFFFFLTLAQWRNFHVNKWGRTSILL